MVDTLKTLKPGNIVVAGDHIFKIAKIGPVTLERVTDNTKLPTAYEEAVIRTCPPSFNGGELAVADYGSYHILRFVGGDHDKYLRILDRWVIDLTCAAVGEGTWMAKYDIGDLTKLDLIAYVITLCGPSTRDFIMRRVAALESLPWIPTSNTEYFANVAEGRSKESTMCKAGKVGRKQLYGLGAAGRKRADIAMKRLGMNPAPLASSLPSTAR